jgi:predicted permease
VQAFAEATDVFSAVTAVAQAAVTVGTGESSERLRAEVVDGTYFDVFGVRPAAGRLLMRADGVTGAVPVVVLAEGLWRRSYGGRDDVVGSTIQIDAMPFTVAGIAPAAFEGTTRGFATQLWMPNRAPGVPNIPSMTERGSRGFRVVARLGAGVTPERAQERIAALAATLHATYPEAWTDVQGNARRVTVLPESETRVPPSERGLAYGFAALLLVVVGLVLLLCCANIANLLLARATGRRREIAVRVAIGADRGRLLRQLLTESLLLAAVGSALGVLVAVWITDFLPSLLPAGVVYDFAPDPAVLAYAFALTVGCAILFGLAPALQALRADVLPALRGETPSAAGRRWGMRDALVVVQVAISIIVIVGAGLFLRSLQEAARIDPGFDPDGVLLMSFALPGRDVPEARQRAFEAALRERVTALPGVTGATFAQRVPIAQPSGRRSVRVEGYEPAPGEEMEFPFNVVGPDYFALLRVPLARGRGFEEGDRDGSPAVIVVNETFARRFWPDQDAIGRRVQVGQTTREVVGVARDGKYWSLGEAPRPYYYLPRLQENARPILHVKTAGAPLDLVAALRAAARAVDPTVVVLEVRTMEDAMATSLLPQRMGGTLLSGFGLLALILAGAGLYGVMAYAVGRRIREFGLRIALGARRGEIMRLVLGRAMALTLIGIAVGMVLAIGAGRLTGALLFAVSPTDAATLLASSALLLGVGVLASWLPALRATRSDPIQTLRSE